MLEQIKKETKKLKLAALAYQCTGTKEQMNSKQYTDCMAELSRKLGFGITPESLEKASAALRILKE